MTITALYLLKLSISLSVVWLFYQLVLRRLTFYNLNRWYLLGYSLLSFFIPLIDVGSMFGKDPSKQPMVIRLMPAIGRPEDFTGNGAIGEAAGPGVGRLANYWTTERIAGMLLLLGSLLLLARLLVRWLSLQKIRRHATLVEVDGIRIYQVDEDIIPFSFGRSIYINQRLHTGKEFSAIILHEYVHIRQLHTVDMLVSELLCIISWYNPFAWLIRFSIRQNLEFIADDKVLAKGLDKKKYQYHLLQVVGEPRYRLANNFNYSSLKKRIIMMNSIRSAKLHLIKFLFILPLLAVLLLAFRNKYDNMFRRGGNIFINQAGIIVDINGYKPLSGVYVADKGSGIHTVSDARGFYLLRIPVLRDSIRIKLECKLEGYSGDQGELFFRNVKTSKGAVNIAMLLKDSEKMPTMFIPPYMGPDMPQVPGYTDVLGVLKQTEADIAGVNALVKTEADHPEVSLFYLSEDETRQVVIRKDGQVEKYGYPGGPSLEDMGNKYGHPGTTLLKVRGPGAAYLKKWQSIAAQAEKEFHTKDPTVRAIVFPGDSRVIVLPATGKPEVYDMDSADPKERAAFEQRYGNLPDCVPAPFAPGHAGDQHQAAVTVMIDSVEMPPGFDWRSVKPETIYSTAVVSKSTTIDNGKITIPGKIVITTKDFAAKHKLPDLMPLFMVDGMEMSRDAYDALHLQTDQILYTNFKKDSSTLQTFGDKARNGVLFIETKKAHLSDSSLPHPVVKFLNAEITPQENETVEPD